MNLETLLPYAVLSIMLLMVCVRLAGRPLSLRFKRPAIWDLVPIAFVVYMPVVGAVIPNGFVASVVVVLSAVALWLLWRRNERTCAEAAPPAR